MKLPSILNRYLAAHFLRSFLIVLSVLLAIVFLFDTLEILRRASGNQALPISTAMKMAMFKLPEVGQLLLPFAVLFSAMASFWWLARRHELTALRSAGFSAWQFCAPLLISALFIGILHITILHPIAASMLGRYQNMESNYLGQQKKLVALSRQGLWLRDSDPAGEIILHAATLNVEDWSLNNTMLLFFDEQGTNTKRLDAQSANLKPGFWKFNNVTVHTPGAQDQFFPTYTLSSELTLADIQESFSDPDTISFWKLPGFIETLEGTGLETATLRVYYHNLLSQPLLLMAMILLAATVSLRPPRFQRALFMVLTGMCAGFGVFFLSSFLRALGGSHQLPVPIAAWSTALIVLLASITWLLNTEDG